MATPQSLEERKAVHSIKGLNSKRVIKRFQKQTDYDSDPSDEEGKDFQAAHVENSYGDRAGHENSTVERNLYKDVISTTRGPDSNSDSDLDITDGSNSDSSSGDDHQGTQSNPNLTRKRKRNDPEAFATSMSKILSSRLSTSKRGDPVLSRSVTALQASKEITDQALEKKARHKLREERRAALDKGRVKDVIGASTAFDAGREDVVEIESTAEIMELEKRLRKTAQRGVVKLFNAVRAAQIKGEEAAKESRRKGLVGYGRREERVNEMSKKGFLELIAGGGRRLKKGIIQEA